MTLGQFLLEKRLEKCLLSKEMAKLIDVSASHYTMLERDKSSCSMKTLRKIAKHTREPIKNVVYYANNTNILLKGD